MWGPMRGQAAGRAAVSGDRVGRAAVSGDRGGRGGCRATARNAVGALVRCQIKKWCWSRPFTATCRGPRGVRGMAHAAAVVALVPRDATRGSMGSGAGPW